MCVRRLRRSACPNSIPCEAEMALALVPVRVGGLMMVRKEEDELADLVVGGRWQLEVDDGAEVVGCDARALCAAKGDVGQFGRHGNHEGGVDVVRWESAIDGALVVVMVIVVEWFVNWCSDGEACEGNESEKEVHVGLEKEQESVET